MMTAQISQKEYLKKYLNIGSDKKKKKKKKKTEVTSKFPRTCVFDDDIDLKSLISKNNDSGEDEKEDAPLVAEVIDDRPESLKRKEFFKNSQWRTVGSTGDIHQPSESLEIKSATSYQKETVRSEHSSPSKVRSISQSNRNSLDVDKPSSRLTGAQTARRRDSDSDQSLPRSNAQTKRRHDSDSDQSLPRSGTQTKRRHDSDSDQSLPRSGTQTKRRHDSDSDQSLPRSKTQTKRRHDSDSDQSLSRVREMTENKKRQISESENNIGRRNKKSSYINEENFEKQRNESSSEGSQSKTKPRHGSVGDHSPPRLKERRDAKSPLVSPKVSKHSSKEGSRKAEDVSLKNGVKERSVTLVGLKAGLQDATSLKDEIREFKRHEDEMMKMIGDKMSGKGAETVFRDRATGKKRDLKEERRKQRQEEQKKSELEEKYMEWGKGIKQKELHCARLEQDLYEMSKPLARYVDDPDLEKGLKEQEREGDPMLAFMRKKKSKGKGKSRPLYQGPTPPPNRFGIMPGYRWDGVDRSNGFEKRCFEKMASKKAFDEEAYKWSVGDM